MKVQNEMGVVVEFAGKCGAAGWTIEHIQSEFPDALMRFRGSETLIAAEFEFVSSNFSKHRHDITRCDLIICWEHDWPDCPLRVLELSNDKWETFEPDPAAMRDARVKMLEMENQRLRTMLVNAGLVLEEGRPLIPADRLLAFCELGDRIGFSYRKMISAGFCKRNEWETLVRTLSERGVLYATSRSSPIWNTGWNIDRFRLEQDEFIPKWLQA